MDRVETSGRWILIVAALSGASALVLSAASAHALKTQISAENIPRLMTANHYLMYYSLVLLVLGGFYQLRPWQGLPQVAALFTAGAGIFCSGLYILCFTEISNVTWLVPLGGLTLLAGWLRLAWTFWRQRRER